MQAALRRSIRTRAFINKFKRFKPLEQQTPRIVNGKAVPHFNRHSRCSPSAQPQMTLVVRRINLANSTTD
jgi:hypothetical protein